MIKRAHSTHAARGSILVVVLWACLGLVAITLTFGHSMLMTYRGTDNELAGKQADQAIEGAARYAETLLANATTPGLFPDVTTYNREAQPVGEATFWFLGRPLDTSSNGTTREYGLVDEASKLNLNTATAAMLEKLPGMTTDLAAAIVEWRTPSTNGASSTSSTVKGGPFESIEELGLVTGATREIIYGEDANLNGVLDANEDDNDKSPPTDNGDGKLDAGILEYVTVFSREPNTQADGTARINITATPPPPELDTLLKSKFGDSRAQEIQQGLGGGGGQQVRSVLDFYVRSGMSEDEFAQVADALTTKTGTYLTGMVNVNTASETVLACLPGIDADTASKLVAARASRTTQDTNIAWVAAILGRPGVALAGEFLTGQSWQVSADVAAVGRHGRGWRRARFVIDQSTKTPRIIYRRNLAGLGWALGADVRQTLAQQKEVR